MKQKLIAVFSLVVFAGAVLGVTSTSAATTETKKAPEKKTSWSTYFSQDEAKQMKNYIKKSVLSELKNPDKDWKHEVSGSIFKDETINYDKLDEEVTDEILSQMGDGKCTSGQIMKYNGSDWACAAENSSPLGDMIESAEITDETIVAGDIAPDAVDTSEIKNGAVTSEKIAFETIDTDDVKDLSITLDDLAPQSVGSGKILNNSVRGDEISYKFFPGNERGIFSSNINLTLTLPTGEPSTICVSNLSSTSGPNINKFFSNTADDNNLYKCNGSGAGFDGAVEVDSCDGNMLGFLWQYGGELKGCLSAIDNPNTNVIDNGSTTTVANWETNMHGQSVMYYNTDNDNESLRIIKPNGDIVTVSAS